MFERLIADGFNFRFSYHADAILQHDFPDAVAELESAIEHVSIPIVELVRGGGGEALITQRMRRTLDNAGWRKGHFNVEKKINERTTFAQTHEVDHVKPFEKGTIVLEIEWNNKDPFFDRDLENYNRLHADGAISVGIIVTRGDSLQNGVEAMLQRFARSAGIGAFEDLAEYGIHPTPRQQREVRRYIEARGAPFADAWAACFKSDKFGTATTHWDKLTRRLDRGVGSPCPIVAIGIPLSRLTLPGAG